MTKKTTSLTFADMIGILSDSEFQDRATEGLNEVAAGVDATGSNGKITITLTIKKDDRGLVIVPRLKSVRPEPTLTETRVWMRPTGGLTADAPQMKLKLAPTVNAERDN